MSFDEVRFPERLAFGSRGGPERRTEIVTLGSGFEERNAPWAESRRRYAAGQGASSLDDLHTILGFFEARRGRLRGFRWKDFSDWKSCAPGATPAGTDQALGLSDGVVARFLLKKAYASGGVSVLRRIFKPVAGTVKVAVDSVPQTEGTDYLVDTVQGAVTFLAGHVPANGAQVTAGYEFDVPVRFDTDLLEVDLVAFEAGSVPDIPVVEIRIKDEG